MSGDRFVLALYAGRVEGVGVVVAEDFPDDPLANGFSFVKWDKGRTTRIRSGSIGDVTKVRRRNGWVRGTEAELLAYLEADARPAAADRLAEFVAAQEDAR